jgi:C4-dicarboxylate transporter, DctM subunit
MSPFLVGGIGIIVLLILFAIGMPVAFALALTGMAGYAFLVSTSTGMALLPRDIFEQFASYPLTVIPMFVMMGCYAFGSGIGKKLFETAYVVVGELRGGLAVAVITACTIFGAVCGSTSATCATIGKVALPEMKKYNYDDEFATGTLATAGGLGIMIPPSTVFIVYGVITEQSIGKLYISGIIPGLLLATLFIATAWIMCKLNPRFGPAGPHTSVKAKLISLAGLLETVALFAISLGGLFLGWFSPTQSGAIGSVGAILIGIINRQLTWQKFWSSTKEGIRISCMILVLIASATIFGHFLSRTTMPLALVEWATSLTIAPVIVMILIQVFWFVLGTFLDAMACMVIALPIIFPLVEKLGFDPIWFGVMIVVQSMMAVVSPPEGVNIFVTKGIAKDVPVGTIFKGTYPYLAAFFIAIVILFIFPQLATFLPQFITY